VDVCGGKRGDLHGHGDGTFLGIGTGEGHPGDVERVGECAEGLSPDNTEVTDLLAFELGESTVEDVADHMASKTGDDGFTTEIAVATVSIHWS